MSDEETKPVKKVYAAIAAVQAELSKGGIGKNKRNEQQGFMFRGIDDVHNALAPVFAKHGLLMLPRVISREYCERGTTSKGTPIRGVTLEVEYDLICAEDGSCHVVRLVGEGMDMADKATNKALSIAYKYAAIQSFCIPVIGLEDPDADSPGSERRRKGHQQKIDKMRESFATLKVTRGQLEAKLGHPMEQCTDKEIDELRGIFQSIKDGKSKWTDHLGGDPSQKRLSLDDVKPGSRREG